MFTRTAEPDAYARVGVSESDSRLWRVLDTPAWRVRYARVSPYDVSISEMSYGGSAWKAERSDVGCAGHVGLKTKFLDRRDVDPYALDRLWGWM